jgi:hypothetical protein
VDRAYLSRVERALTYVGLEIIGKLATILGDDTRGGPSRVLQAPRSAGVSKEGHLSVAGLMIQLSEAGFQAPVVPLPASSTQVWQPPLPNP